MNRALDLFAGPGGWDIGARELGIDPLGIEFDAVVCATRGAAGLRWQLGDVAAQAPSSFAPVELLIASPPCQAFSMAGKREGEADLPLIRDYTRGLVGGSTHPRESYLDRCADPRSLLVAEPLRWAVELMPPFIAWEQVPPVLDYWRLCAGLLGEVGYDVWTGILEAERYGVPQTRERAVLMARRDVAEPIHPPAVTHQRYVPGEGAQAELTLEGELLPWVSMAEALGWAEGRVGFPRQADDGAATEDGYRERDFRDVDEPAFNLTEKARSWDRTFVRRMRANAQSNAAERDQDEPAPTIKGGNDFGERRWIDDRPATTVQGDPRVWPPGHKVNADDGLDGPERYGTRAGPDAIRVSVDEAAVLQGFPRGYPWQGSRTAQFQQVGNAIPPPLARAILAVLIPAEARAKVSVPSTERAA